MPAIRIPTPLRPYTGGQSEVVLTGGSVNAALQDLQARFPALGPHLFNGNGDLRPFVNLYLGQDNIKDLQGLETPLKEDDRLMLLPSIAGG